ncbi:hypothetical protein GNF76_16445 [Pseudomonas sp. CCM 7893]|uniref:Uncharacterized protein n=1 Tax=Pseudomonas spelaei TaxID=1055469 RepID=A0A6I3WDH3_9PSED|nr:hypothetical protein [Pseudomonas spelaei]MUF05944.1 hypothetical protein [Pseudomonas spelaei]
MAVKNADFLSRILGDTKPNHRHDVWLWFYLQQHESAGFDADSCNGFAMRDRIAGFLHGNDISNEFIASEKDRLLVSDDHLKWITGEDRQCEWLYPRLMELTGQRSIARQPHLTGWDLLIAIIDIWDISVSTKIRELNSLYSSWIRHKEMDHQFHWFKEAKEGVQRCQFAWDWLRKHEQRLTSGRPPANSHVELLIFFDQTELVEAERELIIQRIRRNWNRNQSQSKAQGKKQYNFVLSEKIVSLLDELAESHGLKRAKILELLIETEFKTGSHLSGRLKTSR